MTKAVVDVGSNSVLLAIAKQKAGRWEPICETSEVTGLGSGVKQTGQIGEQGAAQTLEALKRAFECARSHGADEILAAGTMALRIAQNADGFLREANAQGTPITILSGEDEARLGFLAVADDPEFSQLDRITVLDPGGHSTELVTACQDRGGWQTLFKRSFPVGALGLLETALKSECPGPSELLEAVSQLDQTVGLCYLPGQCGEVFVLGATGTNLASIREGLITWQPEKIHGQVLDFEEISRAVGWLCGLTESERRAVPGLEIGRERTIHAGALILERFMNAVGATSCRVSVRGWRHALFDHPLP